MDFIPVHKTDNRVLRTIANAIFEPLSHKVLNRILQVDFKYDHVRSEDLPRRVKAQLRIYWRLHSMLLRPYSKWGTWYSAGDWHLKSDGKNPHGISYWQTWDQQDDTTERDGQRIAYTKEIR